MSKVPYIAYGKVALPQDRYGSFTDVHQLRCPYQTPCLVDEIRFVVDEYNNTSLYREATAWNPAASVFATSGIILTAQVGCNFLTPETGVLLSSVGKRVNSDLRTNTNSGDVVWKFKHPVYLPVGAYIRMNFQSRALQIYANGREDADLHVSVVGRALFDDDAILPPDMVKLPYISEFVSGKIPAGTKTLRSVPGQLGNPFDVPLSVHRMLGYGWYPENGVTQATQIKMLWNDGKPIVTLPVYTDHVFSRYDMTQDVDFLLKPREQIYVEHISPDTSNDTTGLSIALHGCREVPVTSVR